MAFRSAGPCGTQGICGLRVPAAELLHRRRPIIAPSWSGRVVNSR